MSGLKEHTITLLRVCGRKRKGDAGMERAEAAEGASGL